MEPAPGVARETVDDGLEIDLFDPLQRIEEESVARQDVADKTGLVCNLN